MSGPASDSVEKGLNAAFVSQGDFLRGAHILRHCGVPQQYALSHSLRSLALSYLRLSSCDLLSYPWNNFRIDHQEQKYENRT